jgi:hypothetical protein
LADHRGHDGHRLLLSAGVLSLLALLGLRLYAAFSCPAIHTPWDDAQYRQDALQVARHQTTAAALAKVLTPGTPPLLDGRVNGYGSWLALGQSLRRRLRSERVELTFQLVNVALLWLQVATVLSFAFWATRDLPTSVLVAFLHASAPVVFGTSRWVHSENLVLLAVPGLSFLAAACLDGRRPAAGRSRRAAAASAALVAYLMGLFAGVREYGAPFWLAIAGCVVASLLVQGRRAEAATFAAVISCFAVPLAGPLVEAARVLLAKSHATSYFHPLREWIPHVALHTVGPALTVVLLAFGAVAVGHAARRGGGQGLPPRAPGLRALYRTHWALLFVYLAAVVASRNRTTRSAIMPTLLLLALLLLYLREHPSARAWLRTRAARLAALGLVACSWGVLGYQLFRGFDGGRTYAAAAYRLEHYNYPLRLRPLVGPDDSYVCYDRCPWDGPEGPPTDR